MSDESSHSSDESSASWIGSFCQEPQNRFFCEVERAFIEDGFNLYGLRPYVRHFKESLDIILDNHSKPQDGGAEAVDQEEEYQENAEMLYGLIHARYIITMHGMETMCQKYERKDFGECPRMLCEGQAVVPMGTKDEPHQDSVRVFCPRCQQVYNPPPLPSTSGSSSASSSLQFGGGGGSHKRHHHHGRGSDSSSSSSSSSGSSSGAGGRRRGGGIRMDGAFIGTTFPHLFFMTYEDKAPAPPKEVYVPRVFGFKLNPRSKSYLRPTLLPPEPVAPAPPGGGAAGAAAGPEGGKKRGGGGGGAGAGPVPMFSSDEGGGGGGGGNNGNGGGGGSAKRRRTEDG